MQMLRPSPCPLPEGEGKFFAIPILHTFIRPRLQLESVSMNLVLASQSPRRKELLPILGIPFEVIPASIDETPFPEETPEDFVARAAREKGVEVASRVSHSIVLSADRSEERRVGKECRSRWS